MKIQPLGDLKSLGASQLFSAVSFWPQSTLRHSLLSERQQVNSLINAAQDESLHWKAL
jgi:hypothetical protein